MNINKLLGFGKTYGLGEGLRFSGIDVTDKSDYVSVMVSDWDERTLVKEVIDSYVASNIRSMWLHRVDTTLLNEMLEMSKSHKYMEIRVDMYENIDDPTLCTKTTFEGIGYGFFGSVYRDDYHSNIVDLRSDVDKFTKSTQTDLANDATIFAVVTEYGDNVMYHFIGRPRLDGDVMFTFSDKKIRDYDN
ncbi:hypothetical protein HOBO_199 [Bacillus phage Hobo]|uniref:Uncharacterized protein n=2 Tax=Caeruleovirus BM15 TaxID=1985178 RepID=A0A0S2MUP4_9CAUD|nr:hypothetical protein FD732_gp142 [Bacillus phage BM15]ALO79607.1 hypothetical protein BM10_203 [Bacillus phage BM15]AXQ66955.1 hypothetical protein HOBO_199 [Bacillus phage Hobo]